MRVLVTGGRDYADWSTVQKTLDYVHAKHGIDVIIHGAASGADSLADKWAKENGVKTDPYRANWRRFGNWAGPIRNAQMLTLGAPDVVLAFPGGRGTADMVRKARIVKVPVWPVVADRLLVSA